MKFNTNAEVSGREGEDVPPKVKRYAVSRQGNRNLVLDHESTEIGPDLPEARSYATTKAKSEGVPWYVFEIEVSLMFAYRPKTEVSEEDCGTPE